MSLTSSSVIGDWMMILRCFINLHAEQQQQQEKASSSFSYYNENHVSSLMILLVVSVVCFVFGHFHGVWWWWSSSNNRRYKKKQHDDDNDDGSRKVLETVLELITQQWGGQLHHSTTTNENSTTIEATNDTKSSRRTRKPVVNYRAPQDLWKELFVDGGLCLQQQRDDSNSSNNNNKEQQLVQMFQDMHHYSVDTNHKFFFNQLFGTLDPVALAAELYVTACCHTSAYTYETAPVLTLLEHDCIQTLCKLVFHPYQNDDESSSSTTIGKTAGDGLFCPGGSFSNLLALHVARQYWYNNNCHFHDVVSGSSTKDSMDNNAGAFEEEEKKSNDGTSNNNNHHIRPPPRLVALVSAEAHYSFQKAATVTGTDFVIVPTLRNGQMDGKELELALQRIITARNQIPFFVALTAGSTVRGSFDNLEDIVRICRAYENENEGRPHPIWIHVDGAWGGSAIFSERSNVRCLLQGVQHADSFTFNPHKMLGAPQQTTAFVTRHEGVLKATNSTGAKYLFDPRKYGASYDLGDGSLTCGRRPDAVKFWAMYKYYGKEGLATRVEAKVDALSSFAKAVQQSDAFMLACDPWPFNVNFYYLPHRIRLLLKERGISTRGTDPCLPDDISLELSQVSVALKLKLHEAGEMILPYQPLSTQKADCFRLVLAGKKNFEHDDIHHLMTTMDRYGAHL